MAIEGAGMDGDGVEEGVGESSSPSPGPGGVGAGARDVKDEIYVRLVEDGHVDPSDREFRDKLDAHFARLPPSYKLDMSVERAEDVLLHQNILEEARDPERRPAFHIRFLKLEVNPDGSMAGDTEDGEDLADASSVRQDGTFVPIHEIIFSTLDKPKLLSQLSSLLSDVGLNIREAHVLSTIDGYSLDVFVVDGWQVEDTDGLKEELEMAIARNEGSWSGSSSTHSSATEKLLSVQPKIGDFEIDKRLLKMGEKIASGSCGDLYRGSYLGQDVAIKILRSEQLSEDIGVEFAQEITILREVQHRNVVRFIGACTKPPDFCIVTEYMPGGNLYDFLHKHNNFLELSLLLKFALDVCKGMDYLHQNNIIHRDLKTANLLMDENHVVKLADFGVARFHIQGVEMTAETGTYRWMAPEVINHQPYDQRADIFSFAIVLWELATSKVPYSTMTPLQAALGVRQGLRPELPENTHPRLLNLMQRCWEAVPAKRPSFKEIILELEELLEQVQETSQEGRETVRGNRTSS